MLCFLWQAKYEHSKYEHSIFVLVDDKKQIIDKPLLGLFIFFNENINTLNIYPWSVIYCNKAVVISVLVSRGST